MNSDRKKELKDSYKSRTVKGGVCRISCSGNNRAWLQATRDITGLKNRFDFAKSIKSCPDPSMRAEWTKYGIDSFSFEVLEEIEKGEEQTDKEFAEDVNTLYEMWAEKEKSVDGDTTL